MGVDKKDVRSVIHRDPSPTAEAYIQEAGRGGRDGTVAEAVLLWSADDEKALARNAAIIGEKRAYAMADFARGDRCRRTVLLEALGDPAAGKDAPGGEAQRRVLVRVQRLQIGDDRASQTLPGGRDALEVRAGEGGGV